MKTLVMSFVIAAAGLFNSAFAGNTVQQRFAYNTDTDSTGTEMQYIYKVSADGQYLRHHLQYRCTYDAQRRLLAKEILRWDAASAKYCPAYALRYSYEGNAVTVECARWSKQDQAYTDIREKAVYAFDATGLTYQAYEYDADADAWHLTGEHEAEAALLAER